MLAVVTPSIFRDTLPEMIAHTATLLEPGDLHFVILDGTKTTEAQLAAAASWTHTHPQLIVDTHSAEGSVYGNAQRDRGIELAKTAGATWIAFCDDDDKLVAAGVAAIRRAEPMGKPLGFRMANQGRHFRPENWQFVGAIGTPMIVLPAEADLPLWADGNKHAYLSDYDFIRRTCEKLGPPVCHSEVLCEVRPLE